MIQRLAQTVSIQCVIKVISCPCSYSTMFMFLGNLCQDPFSKKLYLMNEWTVKNILNTSMGLPKDNITDKHCQKDSFVLQNICNVTSKIVIRIFTLPFFSLLLTWYWLFLYRAYTMKTAIKCIIKLWFDYKKQTTEKPILLMK